jgi:integrase
MLKEYLATWRPNPEGFLFFNRNGRPYAANKVVEYGLWPVLDKLKIERAGMHAFRHCHASLLMDVGANPKVTKTQMRHSDARVTLGIYSHVIGDSQRECGGLRNSGRGFDSHRPLQKPCFPLIT